MNNSEFAWGAEEIGRSIGRTERQARHLINTRAIPVTKINGIFVGHIPTLQASCGMGLTVERRIAGKPGPKPNVDHGSAAAMKANSKDRGDGGPAQ